MTNDEMTFQDAQRIVKPLSQTCDHIWRAQQEKVGVCAFGEVLSVQLQLLELAANGGCALDISSLQPVGELVPRLSCCLGGVHNLPSNTCCESLHRKVNVLHKHSDLFKFQTIILLNCSSELVLIPLLHLRSQSHHRLEDFVNPHDQ